MKSFVHRNLWIRVPAVLLIVCLLAGSMYVLATDASETHMETQVTKEDTVPTALAVKPPKPPSERKNCILVQNAETKDPIPGVLISVYDRDNLCVLSGSTDEDGSLSIADLQPGKYTFAEISVPAVYLLNRKTGVFSIHEDGTVDGSLIILNQAASRVEYTDDQNDTDASFLVPKTGNIHWDHVLKALLAVAAGISILLGICMARMKGGDEGDAL